MLQRVLIMAVVLLGSRLAAAQAVYAGERSPVSFTVGGSYSYFDAAYAGYNVMGATAYFSFGPVLFDHVSGEAEGRWLTFNSSHGFSEYNYLAGPVYHIHLSGHPRLHPYAKGLIGVGIVNFPHNLAYGRYFAFAPGGGMDITLNRRWRLRADYEYQIWPQAPGIPGYSGMMNPHGVTVGFTYRVF